MTTPAPASIAERRRGERPNQVRADPASNAHTVSDARAIRTHTEPSTSSCARIGPAVGSVNWGRIAENSRNPFRIADPDDDALAEDPARGQGGREGVQRVSEIRSVAEGLDPQVDQLGSSGQLDRRVQSQ